MSDITILNHKKNLENSCINGNLDDQIILINIKVNNFKRRYYMHKLFIDLYENLCRQIDDNRNNTHNIKEKDEWGWSKEDCKIEIAKVLNSEPEKLEPLFSRLAKCEAIETMHYDAHVFDETTDKIFTDIWEYHNGACESGFSGLSFLVQFENGNTTLNESVYVRISDCGEYYLYDFKPCSIIDYKENNDDIIDTSEYGIFKRVHPNWAEYIEKWKKSNKNLSEELSKWEKMLWLGRSLAYSDDYEEPLRTRVKEIEKDVLIKYKDDPDFKRYMFDDDSEPDEEWGDTNWKEISCNVGALRYLLYGEWDLSS